MKTDIFNIRDIVEALEEPRALFQVVGVTPRSSGEALITVKCISLISEIYVEYSQAFWKFASFFRKASNASITKHLNHISSIKLILENASYGN